MTASAQAAFRHDTAIAKSSRTGRVTRAEGLDAGAQVVIRDRLDRRRVDVDASRSNARTLTRSTAGASR